MGTSLGAWTLLLILYQTIICVLISSFTLQCRLPPDSSELREVTLMKLLYFYDPEACGQIHFYNFTFKGEDGLQNTNILWPVKNPAASGFRRKMQVWLSLHIVWLFLSVVNVSQAQRSCGFYLTLLPFTLCGIAILIVDVVCTVLFLGDAKYTKTEVDILRFIESDEKYLVWIRKMMPLRDIPNDLMARDEDTTWISLMFAYGSCRGIVQWILNFWMIKDNYFEGLALYRSRLLIDDLSTKDVTDALQALKQATNPLLNYDSIFQTKQETKKKLFIIFEDFDFASGRLQKEKPKTR